MLSVCGGGWRLCLPVPSLAGCGSTFCALASGACALRHRPCLAAPSFALSTLYPLIYRHPQAKSTLDIMRSLLVFSCCKIRPLVVS